MIKESRQAVSSRQVGHGADEIVSFHGERPALPGSGHGHVRSRLWEKRSWQHEWEKQNTHYAPKPDPDASENVSTG